VKRLPDESAQVGRVPVPAKLTALIAPWITVFAAVFHEFVPLESVMSAVVPVMTLSLAKLEAAEAPKRIPVEVAPLPVRLLDAIVLLLEFQ
jgi:hypothetical protein